MAEARENARKEARVYGNMHSPVRRPRSRREIEERSATWQRLSRHDLSERDDEIPSRPELFNGSHPF